MNTADKKKDAIDHHTWLSYRIAHTENPVDHANDYWEEHICDTFGYAIGDIVNFKEAQLEGQVLMFTVDA